MQKSTSKKAMKITAISLFSLVAIILVFVFVFNLSKNKEKEIPDEGIPEKININFSHPAGFYAETFSLELSCDKAGFSIYYTTDGLIPTTENAKQYIAGEPIPIEVPEKGGNGNINVTSVRAFAINPETGETSEVFTESFVKGKGVNKRFAEDTLVFALNSDPHGLYDHNDGIFVEGIDRENWKKENKTSPEPTDPANFNRRGRESEREVYVETFNFSGECIISQNAGMRVKGGWSRADSQKTLELYARKEYDRNNTKFDFPFFDEVNIKGEPITSYKRIRLRNGGNDRDFGMVRDELGQELFRKAGHPSFQLHTPAAIFLNGEYYGFAWLKTPRTENQLSKKFGGESNGFRILGADEKGEEGEEDAIIDWAEVMSCVEGGLTSDDNFNAFCEKVDIDDFMRYYAIQIYINNKDWPHGNIEMWRYFPEFVTEEEREKIKFTSEYLDGKWRFFPQDIEFSWNLYGQGSPSDNTIDKVLTGKGHMGGSSIILPKILEREDMKFRFANTLVDLYEGAFAPENVKSTLDPLIRKIWSEVKVAIDMNFLQPDNEWWPSNESVKESHDMIRAFAEKRPSSIEKSIGETLGLDTNERYKVKLTVLDGGFAVMNTRLVSENETITANYYKGKSSQIKITAKPNDGFVVDYWEIDGERHENKDESILVDSDCEVSLYFKAE